MANQKEKQSSRQSSARQTNTNQKNYLASGESARLFPVVKDSLKEQRLSSMFLAVFATIPDLAKQLLLPLGEKLGKTSKIETLTEVVFKNQSDNKDRPDGLLIITTGKREWRALLEVKIGKKELEVEQINRYLKIARDLKFDAVITVSNQFVARPDHPPVNVDKRLLRSVKLYHWSWKFIQTEATLLSRQGLENPSDSYLLNEFIRFLDDDSDCISGILKMPNSWKDLLNTVKNRGQIDKRAPETQEVVATWYSEIRELQLHFSQDLSTNVIVNIKRAHTNDPRKRLDDGCKHLAESGVLEAEFAIPDAASLLYVVVNIREKTIHTSMNIDAPGHRTQGPAMVNWLLNQLKDSPQDSIFIRFKFAGRTHDSVGYSLEELNNDDYYALQKKLPEIPKSFEIYSSYENSKTFYMVEKFIQELEQTVLEFYSNAGQYLQRYVPRPPKPLNQESSSNESKTTIEQSDENSDVTVDKGADTD